MANLLKVIKQLGCYALHASFLVSIQQDVILAARPLP